MTFISRKEERIMTKTLAAAAVLLAAIASPAAGQGMGGGMGMGMWQGLLTKLCAKELQTLCPGAEQGLPQRTCLEGKSKDLSEACRLTVESTGPDRGRGTGPVATLCMNEIAKFCPEVEHAFGKVRMCLSSHKGELGEACTVALENTGPGWVH
jgi:hypothetical protein